ncbi:MAG: hypothetical protein M5U12_17405 [Verrucomicrobia bacterium]|nr:hypothetical protein [Verrucomicrobiota bacterium]
MLALDPRRGVVGVQATGQDFVGHLRKLTEERAQECLDWLRTPGTCARALGLAQGQGPARGQAPDLAAPRPGPHPLPISNPNPRRARRNG